MTSAALPIISRALQNIGAIAQGESPSAAVGQDSLVRLNLWLDLLKLDTLSVPFVSRQVFPLVALQGGPDTPYTIGPGADFDTQRPQQLEGAGLILGGTDPAVEIPRAVFTDDGYEAVQLKTLTNALFTGVYYNPTYASQWGTIQLWPVPNTALNSLVLYLDQLIDGFANLTQVYDFPPGYLSMMEYGLSAVLAEAYGRELPPNVARLAQTTMGKVKRQNYKLSDMPQDPATTTDHRGFYNIRTGNL